MDPSQPRTQGGARLRVPLHLEQQVKDFNQRCTRDAKDVHEEYDNLKICWAEEFPDHLPAVLEEDIARRLNHDARKAVSGLSQRRRAIIDTMCRKVSEELGMERDKLHEAFGNVIEISETFLRELRKLPPLGIPFAEVLTILREERDQRRSTHQRGISSTASWLPRDVKRAIVTLATERHRFGRQELLDADNSWHAVLESTPSQKRKRPRIPRPAIPETPQAQGRDVLAPSPEIDLPPDSVEHRRCAPAPEYGIDASLCMSPEPLNISRSPSSPDLDACFPGGSGQNTSMSRGLFKDASNTRDLGISTSRAREPGTPSGSRRGSSLLPLEIQDPDSDFTDDDINTSLQAATTSLSDRKELNDEAINTFLEFESKGSDTGIALETTFTLDLSGAWKPVPRKSAPMGKILIPLHHERPRHWSILLVDLENLTLDHYDSCSDDSRFQNAKDRALEWIRQVAPDTDTTDIKCVQKPCPQQSDTISCGLYVLAFGAALLNGEDIPETVDPQDVRDHYRGILQRKLALAATQNLSDGGLLERGHGSENAETGMAISDPPVRVANAIPAAQAQNSERPETGVVASIYRALSTIERPSKRLRRSLWGANDLDDALAVAGKSSMEPRGGMAASVAEHPTASSPPTADHVLECARNLQDAYTRQLTKSINDLKAERERDKASREDWVKVFDSVASTGGDPPNLAFIRSKTAAAIQIVEDTERRHKKMEKQENQLAHQERRKGLIDTAIGLLAEAADVDGTGDEEDQV